MGPAVHDRPVRRVLRRRDYRLVLGAMAVSTIGDWLYAVALVVFVYDTTGSAAWVAGAGIARLAPYVLFGSLAGVLADRVDRRTVMIAADVVRAALMVALAVLTATGGSPLLAVSLAFCSTAAGTPFGPAQGALLPSVVDDDELAAANSVNSTVEHTSLLVGPALGGLLLLVTTVPVAFAANAATFAVSGVLVAAVRTRTPPGDHEADGSLLAQLREGVDALRGTPVVTVLALLAVGGSFQYGVETVVWVLVSQQRLGTGSEGVGFLLAGMGGGGLLAAVATARLAATRHPERILAATALAVGLPMAALAFVSEPWIAYALVAVEGVGGIVFDVVLLTLLQRLVRAQLRGRVLGLFDSLTVGAILLGMAVTPVLVDLVGLTAVLVGGGLVVPVIALVGLPVLARAGRAADVRAAELAPLVARLEHLDLFDGAGPAAVEAAAAALTDVPVVAGQVVVRQGDRADAVYLITDGRFDVFSTGDAGGPRARVGGLGPGDHFGEIGVLRSVPRTADVVARTGGALLRVDGPAFAEAVTLAPAVPRALREGMRDRLARTHPTWDVPQAGAEKLRP